MRTLSHEGACLLLRLHRWGFASHHKGDDEEHDEDEEENLRKTDGGTGDAAEAERGCDKCDDEKCNGPVHHNIIGVLLTCYYRRFVAITMGCSRTGRHYREDK